MLSRCLLSIMAVLSLEKDGREGLLFFLLAYFPCPPLLFVRGSAEGEQGEILVTISFVATVKVKGFVKGIIWLTIYTMSTG